MQRSRSALLAATSAFGLTIALLAAPAGAAGGDHGGDDGRAEAAHTEDTDTNDGGTAEDVADAGDNQHPSGNDRSVEGSDGTQGSSTSDPDDDGRGPDRSNGGPDKPDGSGGDDLADQDGNNGCGNDDDFEDDNEGWCGRKHDTTTADAAEAKADAADDKCVDAAGMSHDDDDCDDDDGDVDAAAKTRGGHADDEDDEVCVDADAMTVDDDDECDDEGEVLSANVSKGAEAGVLSAGLTAPVGSAAVADTGGEVRAAGAGSATLADLPLVGAVAAGALAFTGDHLALLLALALGLVAAGVLVVRRSRGTTSAG